MKWLLAPLAFGFFIVIFFRNLLFDFGILKIKKFSTPIISIGNLSMGGTGKTPHVAYLLRIAQRSKKRVCIVSRGYGGHYGGYASRVDAEKDNAAYLFGDEPVYYAKNFSVPVYVAHDRSTAVELAIKEIQPEIIFSDDSFQHRWMGRHKDIVLMDATDKNLCLFPMGTLREPLSSLRRAQWVFLTKTNFIDEKQKFIWIEKLEKYGFSSSNRNLFLSNYGLGRIDLFRGVTSLKEGERVLLASSIAKPDSFYDLMKEKFHIEKHFVFNDHHLWQQKDVDAIEYYASKENIKNLLITEKDAVKMDLLVFRFLQVHVAKLALNVEPILKFEDLLSV